MPKTPLSKKVKPSKQVAKQEAKKPQLKAVKTKGKAMRERATDLRRIVLDIQTATEKLDDAVANMYDDDDGD